MILERSKAHWRRSGDPSPSLHNLNLLVSSDFENRERPDSSKNAVQQVSEVKPWIICCQDWWKGAERSQTAAPERQIGRKCSKRSFLGILCSEQCSGKLGVYLKALALQPRYGIVRIFTVAGNQHGYNLLGGREMKNLVVGFHVLPHGNE